METATVEADPIRWGARYGPDLAVASCLAVGAYLLRRGGSATDGLWYDDAWVAAGAIEGSVSDIPMTGGAHPGYTLMLMIQHDLVGGNVARFVLVTFLFGVLGPSVVYACLRSLRYGRAGSLLVAAALMVTPSHVAYSGRVKSYTIDVVLVMGLAAVLPRLAERRWTWKWVVGWVVAAIAIGSISGYVMLASATAIGILVLHPQGDRWLRAAALGAQGLVQGGWVLYTRRFVDLDEIEAFMESGYDAHVERSANPLVLAQNLWRHFGRVVDVHPGAPSALLGFVAAAVLVGLALGALGGLDRRRTVVSRFALVTLVAAAIGGLFDRFPFGPRTFDLLTALGSPGARHSLWLVPVTAIGLCNVIDRVGQEAKTRPVVSGALRIAVVASAALLVFSRWQPADPYLGPGRARLAAMVEREADRGAYIVFDQYGSYQFVGQSDRSVRLVATPEAMVGFDIELRPQEGVVLGPALTAADLEEVAASTGRRRLVVWGYDVPYGDDLVAAGWVRGQTEVIAGVRVTVWRTPAPT